MKINIQRNYIFRCLFVAIVFTLLIPFFGLFVIYILDELLVGLTILMSYILLILLLLGIFVLYSRKKLRYKILYLYDSYFEIQDFMNNTIEFSEAVLFVDNPFWGLVLSPINLPFEYHIIADSEIKEGNIKYTDLYLSFIEYHKLKQKNISYIKI